MLGLSARKSATPRGLMARLRSDVRGNTLAMMAIALIPVSALAGSAVDMARLYVVKVRLQQACDAGALAGRKFMADSNSTTLDSTASARATTFFNNNFSSGWMRTASRSFTPSKTADNQVAGVASVVVPMTIMKMFAAPDVTLNVTCEARYDVADTDIMFVLDTTGSMACQPEATDSACSTYVNNHPSTVYTRPSSNSDAVAGYLGSTSYAVPEDTAGSGSRIAALRQAVKDFYSTVAANVDASTHVRYGFVTYTSTVNAGKAIMDKSASYIVGGTSGDQWNYQSRSVNADYTVSTGSWTNNGKTSAQCTTLINAGSVRSPSTAKTYNTSTGQASLTTYRYNSGNCQTRVDTLGPQWIYKSTPLDTTGYVSGSAVTDPTKVDGSTTRWHGCVEERYTEAGVTSFGSDSRDLDPDLIPTSDIKTRWKPMWADVIYGRNRAYSRTKGYYHTSTDDDTTNGDDTSTAPNWGTSGFNSSGFVSCGKPVHRLSTMTAADVANYVDASDFKPLGGTYHDTGMIWGTRMLSPNGIFSSDTAAWAGRRPPNRVLVFLTDGAMAPSQTIYGMYGFEYFDRRVSDGDFGSLTDYHNARFLSECSRARALGIDVWTVAIDDAASSTLTSCASSGTQALFTTSGSGLSDAFKKIAKQVAMLRLSK